jgi:hypothetical protein
VRAYLKGVRNRCLSDEQGTGTPSLTNVHYVAPNKSFRDESPELSVIDEGKISELQLNMTVTQAVWV